MSDDIDLDEFMVFDEADNKADHDITHLRDRKKKIMEHLKDCPCDDVIWQLIAKMLWDGEEEELFD